MVSSSEFLSLNTVGIWGQVILFFSCAGSSLLLGFSLVTVSRGYSLVAMRRFLTVVASLAVEQRL